MGDFLKKAEGNEPKELVLIRVDKIDPRTEEGLKKIMEMAMYGGTYREIAAVLGIDVDRFKIVVRQHPEVAEAIAQGKAVGSLSAKKQLFEMGVKRGRSSQLALWTVNNTDYAYAGRPPELREDAEVEQERAVKEMTDEQLVAAMAAGIKAIKKDMLPALLSMVIDELPEAERVKAVASSVIPSKRTSKKIAPKIEAPQAHTEPTPASPEV